MREENRPATTRDVKAAVGPLREEMKEEFGLMREEITAGFGLMRAEMRELIRPLAITLAHHTAEFADIRGYVKTSLVTRDEFHNRMDGFARRVEDQDYASAKSLHRLDEHEKRISALEEKRA